MLTQGSHQWIQQITEIRTRSFVSFCASIRHIAWQLNPCNAKVTFNRDSSDKKERLKWLLCGQWDIIKVAVWLLATRGQATSWEEPLPLVQTVYANQSEACAKDPLLPGASRQEPQLGYLCAFLCARPGLLGVATRWQNESDIRALEAQNSSAEFIGLYRDCEYCPPW